jgi:hypothetical protein
LEAARHSFSRTSFDAALAQFAQTGAAVVVRIPSAEAPDWKAAIADAERYRDAAAGALAMVSANPVVPLCAFANAEGRDGGVRLYVPEDRMIRHAANVPGFRDAASSVYAHATLDPKFELLLRLYRASLREPDVDHQILFQLVLLEEASDKETGVLAERIGRFVERHRLQADLDAIVSECGIALPPGKTVVNLLVALRNAAAHNGRIDENTLIDWAAPLVRDKRVLHKMIGEMIRCMFCTLVGKGRESMALEVRLGPGSDFVLDFGQ